MTKIKNQDPGHNLENRLFSIFLAMDNFKTSGSTFWSTFFCYFRWWIKIFLAWFVGRWISKKPVCAHNQSWIGISPLFWLGTWSLYPACSGSETNLFAKKVVIPILPLPGIKKKDNNPIYDHDWTARILWQQCSLALVELPDRTQEPCPCPWI